MAEDFKPKEVTIAISTVENVLKYLETKPFGEVVDVFMELKRAAETSFVAQMQAHAEEQKKSDGDSVAEFPPKENRKG